MKRRITSKIHNVYVCPGVDQNFRDIRRPEPRCMQQWVQTVIVKRVYESAILDK